MKYQVERIETRLRKTILDLLDQPVTIMKEQHDSIELLKDIGRKNSRRLYEVEFAAHKLMRTMSNQEKFSGMLETMREEV
jgi:hypothetical protein